MTESEWRTTKFSLYLLKDYPAPWDNRKAALAGCACVRRAWQLIDEWSRRYVELLERVVEGEDLIEEFERLRIAVWNAGRRARSIDGEGYRRYELLRSLSHHPDRRELITLFEEVAYRVKAHNRKHHLPNTLDSGPASAEEVSQCVLLRDVFGNPFRPVTFSPEWFTPEVVALAQETYESRDFSLLPILADAIQDAGCEDEEVLAHCRGPGPHVRGCYVVDSLLGKS